MRSLIPILSFLLLANGSLAVSPALRSEDKTRIIEAFKIADLHGDKIWKGFNQSPKAFLLIHDSVEFLMFHPRPSDDFTLIEFDSTLGTNVYWRPRVLPKMILAAFPAVNGVSTIVAGTPENTQTSSTQWIIKVLHERFHQYQQNHERYFAAVSNLPLSKADSTGQWMLNYPFPYDDTEAGRRFEAYKMELSKALANVDGIRSAKDVGQLAALRKTFVNALSEHNRMYFWFQLWQEGLGRYTEYKFLEYLDGYAPASLVALNDYKPFSWYRDNIVQTEKQMLEGLTLPLDKRATFYTVGYAEARILDRLSRDWRDEYFKHMFFADGLPHGN